MCERYSVCVCVRERESMCVCVRDSVCERERVSECVQDAHELKKDVVDR